MATFSVIEHLDAVEHIRSRFIRRAIPYTVHPLSLE
jgi:hypothetical protein